MTSTMASTRRSIRGAFVALVGALALLAAACGSGGSGPATISIGTLRAAAENSQSADTQSYRIDAQMDVKGQSIDMKGSGVVATDGSGGRLKLNVGGLDVEEIITPDGYYMDLGALGAAKLPDGKRWVFVSFADMASKSGVDVDSLRSQSDQNSTHMLEYLQSTTGDVREVGTDTVNGEPATHYVTKLDYAKFAAEKMPDATDAQRARIAKLGTVPIDVWINGDDRVVKQSFDIDGAAMGSAGGRMKMTMEITGFGEPLDATAPPADEVISLSELQGGSGSSTAA